MANIGGAEDVRTDGPYLMFDDEGKIHVLAPHQVVRDYGHDYRCVLNLDDPASNGVFGGSRDFWNLCSSGCLDTFAAAHLLKNRALKAPSVVVVEAEVPESNGVARIMWCIRIAIGVQYHKLGQSSSAVVWCKEFLWPISFARAHAAREIWARHPTMNVTRLANEWSPTADCALAHLKLLPFNINNMFTLPIAYTMLTVAPYGNFQPHRLESDGITAPAKEPYLGTVRSVRDKTCKSVAPTRAKRALFDKSITEALDSDLLDAVVRLSTHECYRKMGYDFDAREAYAALRRVCSAFRDIVDCATTDFYMEDYHKASSAEPRRKESPTESGSPFLSAGELNELLTVDIPELRRHFVGTGRNATVLLGHVSAFKRAAGVTVMADLTNIEWEAVDVVAKAQAPQRFKQLFAPGVVLTDMTAPGGPWPE